MPPASAAIEDRIHAEKIQVLARNLPFTTLTSLAVAVLGAAGSYDVIGIRAWQWAGAFAVVIFARLAVVAFYWRSPERQSRSRFWGYVLTSNVLLSGLMWTIFGILSYAPGNYTHALFLAIIQAGITAGSASSLSAYTPAHWAFAIPTIAGFIIPYASSGERPMEMLAAMGGVFLVVTGLSSHSAERVLTQSIRLRFDKERLIDELKAASVAAEAANVAKSEFLAMMSHELRTPMNSVVAMTELVGQTRLDGEQRGMVSIIRHSAESMMSIIGDVLDLCRIEAGRLSVDDVPFDLRTVIEDVAQMIAPRAAKKRLEVVVDIDPAAIRTQLRGDPAKLRQILLNLAGNAVKFTDRGHVSLGADALGQTLRLRVEDTGPGIPADAQARLFTPFTQADTAVARRHGGTGLGLSICKRLVELMGGQIGFDSSSGKGSRFFFTIRLQPATDNQPAPDQRLEGCRVALAVCPPLHPALERLLSAEGAAIVELAQGPDAVIFDGDEAPSCTPGIRLVPFQQVGASAAHACVRKPAKAGELVDAILAALGRRGPRPDQQTDHRQQVFRAPARHVAEAEGAVILVVEDNPVNRIVLSKILDRFGLVYDVAEDGQAGLDLFRERGYYGLVLTDFHMPRMDGVTLARTIRADGDAATPIIALTADALPQTKRLCVEAGMQGQLIKPLRQLDLAREITQWLPRAVALRDPIPAAEEATMAGS